MIISIFGVIIQLNIDILNICNNRKAPTMGQGGKGKRIYSKGIDKEEEIDYDNTTQQSRRVNDGQEENREDGNDEGRAEDSEIRRTRDNNRWKSISYTDDGGRVRQLYEIVQNGRQLVRLRDYAQEIYAKPNKATRLLNALKGEKFAETKELRTLLGKTVKLYNKAIAQVGKGKRIYSKGVDKEEEIEYSRRAFSFQHKNFPGEKESGSEAHRLAVWWAHRADVQTGDQTLISINNRWYLVERFDDADNHYQVEEFITKAEFEKVFKEIKAYGRSGKIKSVSGSVDFIDKLNKRGYSLEGRKSSSFGYETQYGRENNQIQQLDKKQIKRRERPTSDGNGDSSSGGANRQGDSVRYSRRITDSDGVLLSEEQAEYFKDSKVRDKNGNLLVVYHGSKSDVTTFSERFISSWNMFGRGFYFTTSERRAKGYAKGSLKECYVNLVNPFVSNNKEHLVSLYKEINNTKEDIDSYSEEKGIGGSEFFKICNYLDDIRIDVSKHIKSLGFDGVLHYGYDDIEIVAYYSNQIKLTSNQIPTKNADIRYSRRVLNTEEMRQVIDDVVEMLTVIEYLCSFIFFGLFINVDYVFLSKTY